MATIPEGATVIRLRPDNGQKLLLRVLADPNNREVYVIGSRRRGKSWTVAVAVVRFGLDNPTSPADAWMNPVDGDRPRQTQIAIVAPDYERTKPIYEEIKLWFKDVIYHKDDNSMEIVLKNTKPMADGTPPTGPGAVIKCWSGENLDSIRGRGYDIVVADEAAFLNEALMESAVMPTLLDRKGRLWSPSTPKFGRKNWWCARWLAAHEAQAKGEPIPGIVAIHLGTTWDNPRLDPADVDREAERRDPLTVREEMRGEILDNATNWLDHTKLIPIDRKDIPGNTFNCILMDTAWGKPRSSQIDKQTRRRKDATVIAVVGQDTNGNAYVIDGIWGQEMQPEQAREAIEGFIKKYNIKRMAKEIIADDPWFSEWNTYCKNRVGIPHVTCLPLSRSKDWKIDGIRRWAGELLYNKRMFIAKDCVLWPQLIEEMGNYNEADAISDKCHDDCLTVMADILKPGIWQGNTAPNLTQLKAFDPFYLADAWKNGVVARPPRPRRSRYSIT